MVKTLPAFKSFKLPADAEKVKTEKKETTAKKQNELKATPMASLENFQRAATMRLSSPKVPSL